jgi:hypothetical protein
VHKNIKVVEASLPAYIPDYLEIFESGKYLFLREPAVLKGNTTRCTGSAEDKSESPHT